MDAETDQYAPDLTVKIPASMRPEPMPRGYHLTADLVEQSIRFPAGHDAERPAPRGSCGSRLGACHAPHQAPSELIAHYDALFQDGWDVERERRIARQKAMGIVPASTRSARPQSRGAGMGRAIAPTNAVCSPALQAAYAAMLDHADQHLGRLLGLPGPVRHVGQHPGAGAVGQWRQPGGRSAAAL